MRETNLSPARAREEDGIGDRQPRVNEDRQWRVARPSGIGGGGERGTEERRASEQGATSNATEVRAGELGEAGTIARV
jgi:hypothetical protein